MLAHPFKPASVDQSAHALVAAAERGLVGERAVQPAAQLAAAFGRSPTGVTTVNLVAPGDLQGDRINQIDLRAGKIVRFHGFRTQFSVDLYNALNANPIQTYQQTFIIPAPLTGSSSWLAPQGILPARFAKFTAQFDF